MATVARRRLDDDEAPDLYDPRYPGRKAIRDGKGVSVRLELTDAMPPDARAAMSRRPMLFDANAHRPLYAAISDAAQRQAVESYEAHNRWLQDAWRGKGNPPPPPLRDGESPRDAYIRRLSNAWKPLPDLPARDPDDDDDPKAAATAVEAQRGRWNAESPAKDAAVADRDISYDEYIHHLTTAWKRP